MRVHDGSTVAASSAVRLDSLMTAAIPLPVLQHSYPAGFTCADLLEKVNAANTKAISDACFPEFMPCFRSGDEFLHSEALLPSLDATGESAMWASMGVLGGYFLAGIGWAWVVLRGRLGRQ